MINFFKKNKKIDTANAVDINQNKTEKAIENGADVNLQDKWGSDAYERARDMTPQEIIKYLLKNKDVVNMQQVKDSWDIKYASDAEKVTISIVLEAVKKRGSDLQYVSNRLKNDPEIVWQAINQDFYAVEYAGKELMKNKEFVLRVIDYFEKLINRKLNDYHVKEKIRYCYKGINLSKNEFDRICKADVLRNHNYKIPLFVVKNFLNDKE